MAGFFKMWRVSGITTDGAKISQPIHELGQCLGDWQYFSNLNASDKTEIIAVGKHFLALKEVFDRYLDTESKQLHDDAVKFLVMGAALLQGKEGQSWSWQAVRHFSQGLYGSMDETRSAFYLMNKPVFDSVAFEIKEMIEDAVG